jgi:long-chain acyl-CoA synthetase
MSASSLRSHKSNGWRSEGTSYTSTTLGDLLHARSLENPEAPALFCDNEMMCYRDLDDSSSRLARWLIDQGLRPGDRVAIHWSNSIEVVQIFFALFKAGLIAVPVNIRLKPPEVAWILEHSQSTLCFSEPALAPVAEEARCRSKSLQSICTELPPRPANNGGSLPEVQDHQPAVILYTSGSTSRPKGAVHTHRTLGGGAWLATRNFLDRTDIVLTMTQMMHAAGLGADLLPAISLGIPAALLPAFTPGAALDAIERFRCTYTFGLPALLAICGGRTNPDAARYQFPANCRGRRGSRASESPGTLRGRIWSASPGRHRHVRNLSHCF